MNVVMEKIDTSVKGNRSIELCKGEIPGAHPVHHTIETGSKLTFEANCGYYHIFILIEGTAKYETDGKEYTFDGRTTFVPAPDKELAVTAKTNAHLFHDGAGNGVIFFPVTAGISQIGKSAVENQSISSNIRYLTTLGQICDTLRQLPGRL